MPLDEVAEALDEIEKAGVRPPFVTTTAIARI
jgi:hypothetical protein